MFENQKEKPTPPSASWYKERTKFQHIFFKSLFFFDTNFSFIYIIKS
jgi:TorA maturation chaperone TorD